MDLKYTKAEPTDAEKSVIDGFLCEQGLTGTFASQSDAERRMGSNSVAEVRAVRHLVLPGLHALQEQLGHISAGAINWLAVRLGQPAAEVYGTATFYSLFDFSEEAVATLHICDDLACRAAGKIDGLLQDLAAAGYPEDTPRNGMRWKRSPCLGLCAQNPAAYFTASENRSGTVAWLDLNEPVPPNTETALSLLQSGFENAAPRFLTLGLAGADPRRLADLITFTLKLDHYLEAGGFQTLKSVNALTPEQVIDEIERSGLTGRGGAGFPTGRKWRAVREETSAIRYLVCNADESEPGTFKDRTIIENNPYALIEAMAIAGYACGASKGWIYLRAEYPEAAARLRKALAEVQAAGLLSGSGTTDESGFDIELRIGAGAYICGEETALLNSIEGKRGEPRNKPPFPSVSGLFGKPTAVNNVETLINALWIAKQGAAAYREVGTPQSPGTRLFSISGAVVLPGLYEAAHGITLRQLIARAGGLPNGWQLRCVLLGGAAGVFVGPEELDIELSSEGARASKATLGSGVVMVFDTTSDMHAILHRIAEFFRHESCGQCVPCRIGTVRQQEALQRILNKETPLQEEMDLLAELDSVMRDASICGLGQTASSAIQSGIHRANLLNREGSNGDI